MYYFTIFVCETVPQINDNLMTWASLMKEKSTKELEQLKPFSLKIQKVLKENNMSEIPTIHLTTKVTPAIDFTNEPIIWCDILVVGNNFVDNCK